MIGLWRAEQIARDHGCRGKETIEEAARGCFGKVVELEFRPHAGGYSRALGPAGELGRLVRPDLGHYLNPELRDAILQSIQQVLFAIWLPQRVFQFRDLAKVFATHLAPTQLLMRRGSIFYSPASLKYFGLS